MSSHELAKSRFQPLLVEFARPGDQYQQTVAERRGIAALNREEELFERVALRAVQMAGRAEVEKPEASVPQEQDVSG